MSQQDPTERPVPGREIATTGDGRDITRGYTGALLLPSDRILRGRGAGDLAIYEQVLSEAQVSACFRQRRSAVTSREWQVDAASERAIDQRAADHLRAQLQRIGWDRVTELMLYGVFYGYAVAEIIYGREDGRLTWDRIRVRNRRRFRFAPDGSLRLITPQNPYPGEEVPQANFWQYATGADHDDEPYGLGLAHWLYWPVLFKRNGLKFWLTFLEKFGMPTGVGKYGPDATVDERAKLLGAVEAIQTDTGVILPEGMAIELLEAARSGTADYQALHDTMDATIAKVVLGQAASTQGTPGRLGNDELQGDVRDDIVKADADLICESLNCGPVRWLTRYNFPDADPPRVFRVLDEPEDLDAMAERDTKVFALGFRPGLQYVRDTYGDHWEPGEGLGGPPVAFADNSDAARRHDDFIANLVDQLAEKAGPITDRWVARIRAEVQQATSFEDLLGRLSLLITELPLDELGAVIEQASGAAHTAGALDAGNDTRA